jgi:HK97 family phage major capsid protein
VSDELLPSDALVIDGEGLKTLSTADAGGIVRVGAYAVRFATAAEKDLTGDYFTKSTDFGPRDGDGAIVMFNHGLVLQDGVKALADVAQMTFGNVKATRDDVGIFVEATLNTANAYEKAIAGLCAAGKLKWSSGTAPHMIRKNADGAITRWPIAEVSYTPKPAEPRLPAIRALKSLAVLSAAECPSAMSSGPNGSVSEIAAAFGVDSGIPAAPAKPATPTKALSFPIMTDAEKAAATEKQAREERDKSIKNFADARVSEINEITALGSHFKCLDAANSFIAEGKSLEDFRVHVLEEVKKARPIVTDPRIGMDKKAQRGWSFMKAIREVAFGGGVHALTGVEKEASEASMKSIGRTPKGFFIPHDIAVSNIAETHDLGTKAIMALIEQAQAVKTLNSTTFTSGGALVGTSLLTGSMIELLRNKPLLAQMGARTMTGLVGNVAIPRLNGGATAYWVNEQGSVTGTDAAFGQLGLTPKKLAARTGYTKELMSQTDLSVEAVCRDDLTTILGLAKDLAGINGTGGAQPLGIINQPTGLNSVTFGATATRLKAIEFQKQVAIDNASRGTLSYLMTPSVAATWMGIAEASNYPEWLWKGNIDQGMVVGRPAYSTNQVPSDKVLYGNWQDLILADWAGLDVVVNPYSGDQTGVITITIFLLTDVGVRQVVSFCVSTDSGAQ